MSSRWDSSAIIFCVLVAHFAKDLQNFQSKIHNNWGFIVVFIPPLKAVRKILLQRILNMNWHAEGLKSTLSIYAQILCGEKPHPLWCNCNTLQFSHNRNHCRKSKAYLTCVKASLYRGQWSLASGVQYPSKLSGLWLFSSGSFISCLSLWVYLHIAYPAVFGVTYLWTIAGLSPELHLLGNPTDTHNF